MNALAFYPAAITASLRFQSSLLHTPCLLSQKLLLSILHTPRTLSALIVFLDWSDVYSLLCTCSSLHTAFFSRILTRDPVLCRFVPGYAFCLKHRDLQFYQDVPITIHDLDLLLISQRTDLHRYPTHALRTLTASALSDSSLARTSAKLIKLTQAHSRFVLLFQSLVHSSPHPIPPDPPEDRFSNSRHHQPTPELTFPPPLAFTAHHDDVPPPLPPKDRQFNNSLKKHKHSYSQPPHLQSHRPKHVSRKPSASSYMISPSPTLTHHHHISLSSSPSHPFPSYSDNPRRPSSASNSLSSKPKRRLSIFGPLDPGPPPPPPEEPETLRIRSREWRRARSASLISASAPPAYGGTRTNKPISASDSYAYSYPSDSEFEFGQLRRPNRLFVSEHNRLASSSGSSISLSESRSSWNQGQDSKRSSRTSPPVSPQGYGHSHSFPKLPIQTNQAAYANGYPNPNGYPAPPFAPSIHSLVRATIRNRAPILRVFVPTQYMRPLSSNDSSPVSTLNSSPERNGQQPVQNTQGNKDGGRKNLNSRTSPGPSPQHLTSLSIQACEAQLQDAGLWEHLSTGDVICNLGYIPPDESDPLYTPKVLSPLHRPSLRSFSQHPQFSSYPDHQSLNTWLIFTGDCLVPYTPPSLLPLLSSSPLSLPSPFYYYHIMPAGMNPLFQISELPPLVPPPSIPDPPSHSTPPPVPPKTTGVETTKPNITLALIRTTSLIPSTLSPTGYMKVKKFAWTARVVRIRLPLPPIPASSQPTQYSKNNPFPSFVQSDKSELPHIPQELGDGWLGEWILEYDGTAEGREILIAASEGKYLGRGKVWEVRRERSGGGRVWMRLLPE